MANYEVLVSYDIEKKENAHKLIKEYMQAKGYYDGFIYVKNDGVRRFISLPNTTLFNNNTTAAKAYDDIKECIKKLETDHGIIIDLEKFYAVGLTNSWNAKPASDATPEQIKEYPTKS